MVYFGQSIWLKTPLSLATQLNIVDYAKKAELSTEPEEKNNYLFQIIREISTLKEPTEESLPLLNKMLEKSGMLKSKDSKTNIKEQLKNLINVVDYLMPRLSMSENEILEKFDDKTISRVLQAVKEKELTDSLSRMLETHNAAGDKERGIEPFFKIQKRKLSLVRNEKNMTKKEKVQQKEFIENRSILRNLNEAFGI
jgi:hypothetical protein